MQPDTWAKAFISHIESWDMEMDMFGRKQALATITQELRTNDEFHAQWVAFKHALESAIHEYDQEHFKQY
jgi:hypothetical protein